MRINSIKQENSVYFQIVQNINKKLDSLQQNIKQQNYKHKIIHSTKLKKINDICTNKPTLQRIQESDPKSNIPIQLNFNKPIAQTACTEVTQQISKIKDRLYHINNNKQQQYNKIVNRTNQQIAGFKMNLNKLRQQRIRNKQFIIDRMTQVNNDIRGMLKNEDQKNRIQESKFAELLEDACDHLESQLMDTTSLPMSYY